MYKILLTNITLLLHSKKTKVGKGGGKNLKSPNNVQRHSGKKQMREKFNLMFLADKSSISLQQGGNLGIAYGNQMKGLLVWLQHTSWKLPIERQLRAPSRQGFPAALFLRIPCSLSQIWPRVFITRGQLKTRKSPSLYSQGQAWGHRKEKPVAISCIPCSGNSDTSSVGSTLATSTHHSDTPIPWTLLLP